ncbi:CHAD domain-containing protein [Undibacterium sp. TC4M20W]|uniref:CHAD domain-containing protein n=1 Tax=Undibacterium sp. TC4M20W TaxID=3413052 RepID=UPI003BEFF4B3
MSSPRPQTVAVKAYKLKLRRQMKLEPAARAILENCLEQIRDNYAAIKTGADPDCIRQMHVGLRRLHSALKIFDHSVSVPEKLQAELDYLSKKLGEARDWQVFSCSTLVAIEVIAPTEAQLSRLQQAALFIAEKKQKGIYIALKNSRSERLMSALSAWLEKSALIETDKSLKNKHSTEKLVSFAQEVLFHQHKNLLKRGKKLFKAEAGADPRTSHQFRIAIKNARYPCNFFENLFFPKDINAYINSLSTLQDILGNINDGAVAGKLLQVITERQADHIAGSNFALGYLFSQDKLQQQKLRSAWKKFKDIHLPEPK